MIFVHNKIDVSPSLWFLEKRGRVTSIEKYFFLCKSISQAQLHAFYQLLKIVTKSWKQTDQVDSSFICTMWLCCVLCSEVVVSPSSHVSTR